MEIQSGEYQINFEKLEESMSGNEKILLFCSPHNPGGKVWSIKELKQIAQFCDKHDLILISDEIHNDLVYPQKKHVMYPVAVPEIMHRLIVLVSSSKTFNIAGGLMGNVIIENHALRKKFHNAHQAIGTMPNLFGMKINLFETESLISLILRVTCLIDNISEIISLGFSVSSCLETGESISSTSKSDIASAWQVSIILLFLSDSVKI